MTVGLREDGTIRLEGACRIDDAEPLLQLLLDRPDAAVDWRDCEEAHTAVIQLLTAFGRRLHGPPRGAFLVRFVAPALARTQA